jgi:prepilin-type N-terminal cleavage/methylation domain-containing protein
MQQHRRFGFTLIELLIVVAIIAILAAIAVPNFLEAQVRAKVSRFKADLRSCATAVESYMVDNNKYPKPDKVPAGYEGPDDFTDPPGGAAEGYMPRSITTPIAYMSSLPIDIFPAKNAAEEPGMPLFHAPHYVNDQYNQVQYSADPLDANFVGRTRAALKTLQPNLPTDPNQFDRSALWLAHSHGVDLDHDDFLSDQLHPTEYDPTNGTVSDGDIFYFGPGVGFTRQ